MLGLRPRVRNSGVLAPGSITAGGRTGPERRTGPGRGVRVPWSLPLLLLVFGARGLGYGFVAEVRADPLDAAPAGVAAWSGARGEPRGAVDRESEWREWYAARVQWRQGVAQLRRERARNRRLALLLRQRGVLPRGALLRQQLDVASRRFAAESEGGWVTSGAPPGSGGNLGRRRSGHAPVRRSESDDEVPIELLGRPGRGRRPPMSRPQ